MNKLLSYAGYPNIANFETRSRIYFTTVSSVDVGTNASSASSWLGLTLLLPRLSKLLRPWIQQKRKLKTYTRYPLQQFKQQGIDDKQTLFKETLQPTTATTESQFNRLLSLRWKAQGFRV